MIRHVVMFRWQADATEAQRAAVLEGLAALPGQIEQIRSYRFGADLGLAEGTWDLAVVAEFDSVEDYDTYRDHPAHRDVVARTIHPIADEIARVQHTVEG